MKYFQKELVDTPLYLPSGRRLAFEDAGNSYGILATENPGLLTELAKVIANRRGGVSEISAEAYAELKKKSSAKTQSSPSLSLKALLQRQVAAPSAKKAAVAAAAKATPAKVPPKSAPLEVPNLMPAVGQMWRPKGA